MRSKRLAGLVLAAGAAVCANAMAQDAATDTTGTATSPAATTAAAPATDATAAPAVEPTGAAPVGEATLAPSSAPAPLPAPLPAERVFDNPGKQIQATIGKLPAKEADVALLPVMQLYWAVRNEASATGGVMHKHKSTKEIVAPHDRALFERVLATLQDDLAARFEAAGWQAMTRAELGADVPELATVKVDPAHGMAAYRVKMGSAFDQDWVAVALPGALPPNPKSIGNGMAWGRWLKGKSGINLNVTYSFAPGTVGETKSRQLKTAAGAGLWFSARADLIGATSGAWGNINVVPEGLVVAPEIGTLAEIEGSGASKVANVIGFLGGIGTRDRKGYTMAPDWAKVETEMLRAGRAFNAEVVARLAAGGK